MPGRRRPMTACRSGNHGASASGRTARTRPAPARCSTSATAAKPIETMAPARSDAACQAATPTSATVTASVAADLRPVDRSPSAGDRAADASGDGSGRARKRVEPPDQQQRLDASDLEQRHERKQQRDEQADRKPLQHRRRQSARTKCHRALPSDDARNRATARPRERDAEQAAGQAEQHDLQHVGREHLPDSSRPGT